MEEIWKDIGGYEGLYQISNLGRVKSLERIRVFKDCQKSLYPEQFLNIETNGQGYNRVALYLNGKRKYYFLHRLIAIHFIPNPDNKPHINHKNSIRNDNNISNLEWCTASENSIHGFNFGNRKVRLGLKNNKSKQVIHTETGIFYDTIKEAAIAYGIGEGLLAMKLRGAVKNNTKLKLITTNNN